MKIRTNPHIIVKLKCKEKQEKKKKTPSSLEGLVELTRTCVSWVKNLQTLLNPERMTIEGCTKS